MDFDAPVTRDLFTEVVTEVEAKTSVIVVAIVCDMGSTNQGLWTELGVNKDTPFLTHPNDPERKIFAYADVPHLIKERHLHLDI